MLLQEKFNQLEDLLLNHRESIGIHNGVPFIMLIYSPENEIECRQKIDNMRLSDNPKNSPHIRALFHEFQDFSEKI